MDMFHQIKFDTNTLLYAGAFIITGFQAVCFAIFTRVYAIQDGFLPKKDYLVKWFDYITLELGLVIGILITCAGLCGTFYSVQLWNKTNFGNLEYSSILRVVIPSVVAIIIGMQTILASFFLSVLGINKK